MTPPTYVSLFAGAGGFDVGFDAAGFRCVAQVEIDKTARSVLARHWPDVPRYEDVRQFGKEQVPYADVVVGGFPCQDVSTAGKRKGFEGGERSSLWFEMVRVIRELRPQFVVWENVPGLLSADEGRAFGWVLRELGDIGFNGGWRSVDAQFFGVPQQRRRVFGVFARGHSGAERCAEVLALTEGVRRRTPPRRKAGQGVAAPLTRGSSSGGVNPPGRRQEDDQNLVVTFTERRHGTYDAATASDALRVGGGCRGNANLVVTTEIEAFTFDWQAGGGGNDTSFKGKSRQWICDKPGIVRSLVANKCLAVFGVGSGVPHAAAALTAKGERQDFDTENFVLVQDAREGMETKSQNGSGVNVSSVSYTLDTLGAQAVCIPIDMRQASRGETMTNNRKEGSSGGAPGTGIGEDGDPSPTIAGSHTPAVCVSATFQASDYKDGGYEATDVSRPLTTSADRTRAAPVCVTGEQTHSLTAEGADASEDGTGRGTPIVCHESGQGWWNEHDKSGPLRAEGENRPSRPTHIATNGTIVRRLTPLECERLMGWPDHHTRYAANGKELADGPRYRLCGNGVVGTVSRWLAVRLMRVMRSGQGVDV